MIALAIDENFNHRIVRGLQRRNSQIDVVRVQDAGLTGAADPEVLAWAAEQGRMLITHDVATMIPHAAGRVEAGLVMSGIIVCARSVPMGIAIEDLLLIAECSAAHEWDNQILFLPL